MAFVGVAVDPRGENGLEMVSPWAARGGLVLHVAAIIASGASGAEVVELVPLATH